MVDTQTERCLRTLADHLEGVPEVRLAVAHGSRISGSGNLDADLDLYLVVDSDDWRRCNEIASGARAIVNECANIWLDTSPASLSSLDLEDQWLRRYWRQVLADGRVLAGDPVVVFGADLVRRLAAPLDAATGARLHAAKKLAAATRQLRLFDTARRSWIRDGDDIMAYTAARYLLDAATMAAQAVALFNTGGKARGRAIDELVGSAVDAIGHADREFPALAATLSRQRESSPLDVAWPDLDEILPRFVAFVAAVHHEVGPPSPI